MSTGANPAAGSGQLGRRADRDPRTRRPGRMVVSVHDVAPATAQPCGEWVAELDARGVAATLLVIPGRWHGTALADDRATRLWLHGAADRGHEVAMHGLHHTGVPGGPSWRRTGSAVLARGCAEFAALDERAAAMRLRTGLRMMAAAGFAPVGFTPPGWLVSAAAMRAITAEGFAYTTSHLRVHDLRRGRVVVAPALSHRPGGVGERLGAAAMVALAGRWAWRGSLFRLALHPQDLTRPGLREAALRALDAALGAGVRAVTYAGLLGLDARPGEAPGGRREPGQPAGADVRR